MIDFLQYLHMAETYEQRKVGVDYVDRLRVSTFYTTDHGYETFIQDSEYPHTVERYPTKEAAEEGHRQWCKKVIGLTKVKRLGLPGHTEDEEVELKR